MRILPQLTPAWTSALRLALLFVLGHATASFGQYGDAAGGRAEEFPSSEYPAQAIPANDAERANWSTRDAAMSVSPASAHVPISATPPTSREGDSARLGPLPFARSEPAELPRDGDSPLKLAPPQDRDRLSRPAASSPTGALFTVMGSLGIVLGLFLLVVWFTRRALPRAATSLPAEVVELLGRAPLSPRQNMHVIRFGPKLLLVSVTQGGAETLSEITDVDEVERVTGLCKQNQPGSVTATFRQVLSQFAREPAPGGFLGVDSGAARATTVSTESPAPLSGSRRRRAGETTEV